MAVNNTTLHESSEITNPSPCPLLDRFLNESRGRLDAVYAANCAINAPFSVAAFIANALVMASIWRSSSLRTPSYYLLTGLAMSDLAVGLLAQPSYIIYKVAGLYGNSRLNCLAGVSFVLISNQLAGVSLQTLTLVSLDRFLALYLHLRYNELVTLNRVKIAIFVPWLLSAIVNITWFWNLKLYYMISFLGFAICLLATSFVYVMIFRVVRRHHSKITRQPTVIFSPQTQNVELSTRNSQIQDERASHQENTFHLARYRRSAINMLLVYVLFLFCVLPFLCVLMVARLEGRTARIETAFNFSMTLVFINSTFNPFFFCYRMKDVRQAVKDTLRKIKVKTC